MGASRPTNDGRPLVLVVDDDPDLRTIARLELSTGFDVLQADSGPACVRLAAEHRPDVILLDMAMPGMDGREVLNALSADTATQTIPVIFLSAYSSVDERVRGLESGAVDYIAKPCDSRELVARVGAAARTRARTEELLALQGTDPLTGLPSRLAFESRVAEEVARSRRSLAPLAVALMEIDGMGLMNDRLGRGPADDILRSIARTIRAALRASDVLFRYGGDEFAVILPDANVGTAFLASERVRAALGGSQTGSVAATLSTGIAEHSPGRSSEELIAKAQIALFRAKESGGNRSWRSDDLRRHPLDPVALSQDLTEREWEILAQIARRRNEREIGRRLAISTGTVRSHKARIRRKLHVPRDVRLGAFVGEHLGELLVHFPTFRTKHESRA